MSVGAVGADDFEVALDHLQVGVAEEDLEGERVAAIAEIGNGKRMAKAMRMDIGDTGAVTNALEKTAEDVGVDRAGIVGWANGEKRCILIGVFEAGSEIAPQCPGGTLAKVDHALFFIATAAFAGNVDSVGGEIEVGEGEVAKLAAANPGIEEQEEDGAITVSGGAARGGGAGFPGAAVGAGGEELLELLFGEGFDGGWLEPGRINSADDVGGHVALVHAPGPESGASDVDIGDGFGGEADLATRGDAIGFADVIVLQPGKEGDELGASEGGEGGIVGEEEGKFLVAVAVVFDCVLAFAGGGFVKQAALAGLG